MGTFPHTLIEKWRQKVDPITRSIQCDHRVPLLPEDIEDFDSILENIHSSTRIGDGLFEDDDEQEGMMVDVVVVDSLSDDCDENVNVNTSNFIRSPKPNDEFVYHMTEKYLHQDVSTGMSVFEKKVRPQSIGQVVEHHDNEDE